MTVRTNVVYQGVIRSIRKISVFSSVWRTVKFGYAFKSGSWRLVYKQRLELTLSSPQVDFVLKTWAMTQGWDGTSAIDLVLTANTTFDASSISNKAFSTGASWPAGSLFRLTGNFAVRGRGGVGGAAGPSNTEAAGTNGQNGGNAMGIDASPPAITIDFGQGGFIGSGGGGGAGGATVAGEDSFGTIVGYSIGSAGGNGAGPGAATASPGPDPLHEGGHPDQGVYGGAGGPGGDFGQPGGPGVQAHVDDGTIITAFPNGTPGQPGWAIVLNGNGISLSGNNSSNLRGTVA